MTNITGLVEHRCPAHRLRPRQRYIHASILSLQPGELHHLDIASPTTRVGTLDQRLPLINKAGELVFLEHSAINYAHCRAQTQPVSDRHNQ